MTRTPSPTTPPVVLTIAGSDSGGGAGIQADLKTIEAHGAFGTSVITAVTAQNTKGVTSVHVLPIREIEAQLTAVGDDFSFGAIKTGMLASVEVIDTVVDFVADRSIPLVVDPVMVAASGDRLLDADAERAYAALIEAATLVTPNTDEAAALTGRTIADPSDATAAGEDLLDVGTTAALVKGGHVPGPIVVDVLVTDAGVTEYTVPRVDGDATHGSGCTLASAIATRLAHGDDLPGAVEASLSFMQRAVRYPIAVGRGPGVVHHLSALRSQAAQAGVIDDVRTIVSELVDAEARVLVPEVGMNVVGAPPFAESRRELAAVDGRIRRTQHGLSTGAGVAIGASTSVARFLLTAREYVPSFRYCANCRFDEDVEDALSALTGVIAELDRNAAPPDLTSPEGSSMAWRAAQVYDGTDEPPIAVVDRGAHGTEPMVMFLTAKPSELMNRLTTLGIAIEQRA